MDYDKISETCNLKLSLGIAAGRTEVNFAGSPAEEFDERQIH